LDKNLLYRCDCKEALNHLIASNIKVDLIYLDPPFNSNRNYSLIFKRKGVTSQQKAFADMWELNKRNRQMVLDFESIIKNSDEISPSLKLFLEAWIDPILNSGTSKERKMLVYLVYMTERLVLMKQVLKDTGSIYFHCDPTASHYIKIIMDGIFGIENFRNEIIWGYRTGGNSKKWYAKKHDVILFYSKSKNWTFHSTKDEIVRQHRKYGHKSFKEYKDNLGYYRYCTRRDIWDDINAIVGQTDGHNQKNVKRIGYNTQKPIELLHRIVKNGSNPNDIILDPFCGCGTTIHAAVQNNNRWIGVDISSNTTQVIKDRLKDIMVTQREDYIYIDGSPETKEDYDKMNAYQKQDWLINEVGGMPNQRKSGDEGVDGEMTMHLGVKAGKDLWGKMVFSVKTGDQCKPEFVRELVGTMKLKKAVMGGLIVDKDPTVNMEIIADKKGELEYSYAKGLPSLYFPKVQILTSQQIIDKMKFNTPPTQIQVQLHKKGQLKLKDQSL